MIARLGDILATIDIASEIVAGRTFADYKADVMMRFAVERRIENVSEASRHITPEQRMRFSDIPLV